jgi:hypothetical protein
LHQREVKTERVQATKEWKPSQANQFCMGAKMGKRKYTGFTADIPYIKKANIPI